MKGCLYHPDTHTNIPEAPAPGAGPPREGCAKNMYAHVHALCRNTVFLPKRAVHKLRNKPKFTKPHKEINVCSLWVYLHGAPPRKLDFFFVFNLENFWF